MNIVVKGICLAERGNNVLPLDAGVFNITLRHTYLKNYRFIINSVGLIIKDLNIIYLKNSVHQIHGVQGFYNQKNKVRHQPDSIRRKYERWVFFMNRNITTVSM